MYRAVQNTFKMTRERTFLLEIPDFRLMETIPPIIAQDLTYYTRLTKATIWSWLIWLFPMQNLPPFRNPFSKVSKPNTHSDIRDMVPFVVVNSTVGSLAPFHFWGLSLLFVFFLDFSLLLSVIRIIINSLLKISRLSLSQESNSTWKECHIRENKNDENGAITACPKHHRPRQHATSTLHRKYVGSTRVHNIRVRNNVPYM